MKGIRKTGNTYQWRICYDGKTYSSGGFKNATEADKARREKLYELEHGIEVASKGTRVDEWFRRWLDTYKRPSLKQSSLKQYEHTYRKHVSPVIGRVRLDKVMPEHLQKIMNDVAEESAQRTVARIFTLLHDLFKQAVKSRLIAINPADAVTVPKGRQTDKKMGLTAEQQKKFILYAGENRFFDVFRLALLTGCRAGELLGLQWDDIDFSEKTLYVNHTLAGQKHGEFYLTTPKTKCSRREIPLVSEAVALLRKIRREQNENRLLCGCMWSPESGLENLVFTSKDGRPLRTGLLDYHLHCISARMAAEGRTMPEDFTMHTLRHSFACRWIEAGEDAKTLQHILGHATLAMTMDIYSDVFPDIKADAIRRVFKDAGNF